MSALPSIDRADRAAVGADVAGTLYERHSSRIFAFCLSRLGNREEAEDAAQTTFLNAFRSLQGGLVPQFELAWLFRIADNVCRDRRKSAWRRGRVEATRDLDELQDVVTAPERRSEGLVGLEAALAAMPERQRRAILLREWQGLSYAEIAGELRLSKAAVETLIFRARRSLAQGLEGQPEPQRRARAGFDVGWLLGLAKSLLQGGAAVKVAASVAAIASAGAVASVPLGDSSRETPRARNDATAPVARTAPARVAPTDTRRTMERAAPRQVARRSQPTVVAHQEAARPSASRAATRRTGPAAKASKPSDPPATPGAPPETRPTPPAPTAEQPAPPPASPPPSLAPPVSLPSVPQPPALPPLVPEIPALEPPTVPPLPDLPVDVPDLPGLP
jgi:RNA polymerase sigma-70 factor (ECF subfamily)